MKRILKPGDNLGGLLQMWAIPTSAFFRVKSTVTIISDAEIYSIYCTAETLQFSEKPKETKSRFQYLTEVTGFIPYASKSTIDALMDMEGKPYAILIKDGNESFLLAGSAIYPLKLTAALNQGKKTSDLAGYQIQFFGITISRAVFVDNPF